MPPTPSSKIAKKKKKAGRLDPSPRRASSTPQPTAQLRALSEAFNDFDGDGDGMLFYDEMKALLMTVGVVASERDVDTLWNTLDVDGDGGVTMEDLEEAIRSGAQLGILLNPIPKNANTLNGVRNDSKNGVAVGRDRLTPTTSRRDQTDSKGDPSPRAGVPRSDSHTDSHSFELPPVSAGGFKVSPHRGPAQKSPVSLPANSPGARRPSVVQFSPRLPQADKRPYSAPAVPVWKGDAEHFDEYDEDDNGLLDSNELQRLCQEVLYFFPPPQQLTTVIERLSQLMGISAPNITRETWTHHHGLRLLRRIALDELMQERHNKKRLDDHFWNAVLQWVPDVTTLLRCGAVPRALRRLSATDIYWQRLLRRERRRQQLRAAQLWDLPTLPARPDLRGWYVAWLKSVWTERTAKGQGEAYMREVDSHAHVALLSAVQFQLTMVLTLPGKKAPLGLLAMGDDRGGLQYRDPRRGLDKIEMQTGEHDSAVTCLAETENFILSGGADAMCLVWAKQDLTFPAFALQGHTEAVTAIAVTPDEKRIVTGSMDRNLLVWELRTAPPARAPPTGDKSANNYCTLKAITTLRGHSMKVTCVLLTDSNIVSASTDSHVRIWDWEGQCLTTLTGHNGPVHHIYIHQSMLLSFCGAGLMRVTDLNRPSSFENSRIQKFPISCLAVEGAFYFVGANDGLILAFQLDTQTQVATLEGHTSVVRCMCAMPNRPRLVSAGDDKAVHIWDTTPLAERTAATPLLALRIVYSLPGLQAALLTLVPHILEDGRLYGMAGCSADRRMHVWKLK